MSPTFDQHNELSGTFDYDDDFDESYQCITKNPFETDIKVFDVSRELNKFKGKTKSESGKVKQPVKIINFILKDKDIELFHNKNKPFIRIVDENKFKIYSLNSRDFKNWLFIEYYLKYKTTVNKSAVDEAIYTLSGFAMRKKEYVLHNRVCHHDDAIWYDLGDFRAVKITSDGWNIINRPPILFEKHSHQKSHDITNNIGNINDVHKIFKYVNIYDDDIKILYEVNLVSKIIPDIPHTIDTFYGEHGSTKTTAMKLGKCLIDPSSNLTLSLHRDKNELIQTLYHNYYPVFDNISYMTQEQSDILCRAVTGEGVTKRALYTDDDDVIYNYRRCVGYNGINIAGYASDILDRSIVFKFESIDNTNRRTEKELWSNFNNDKNDIIKGIFSTVSKAMKILPTIKPNYFRMADFTLYGCAIAEALGYTKEQFLDVYYDNQKILNEEVIESDIVGSYIMKFVMWNHTADKHTREYQVSDFYDQLTMFAKDAGFNINSKSWPKSSKGLSRKINRIRINLKEEGIIIDYIRSEQRKYIVTNLNPEPKRSTTEEDYDGDDDIWES